MMAIVQTIQRKGLLPLNIFADKGWSMGNASSKNFAMESVGEAYSVVVVGHSLGAGIGAMVSLLLRSKVKSLRAFFYSPPPIFSAGMVEQTKKFAFSVTLGTDLIARFSPQNMYRLRTLVVDALRSLVKRRESSLCYRLKSIHYDSMFVQQAIKMLTSRLEKGTCLPEVYANLRNGLWYLPKFYGTAYFKSTDGHSHIWNFSFKRLNLHFALSAAQNNGAILVDSTRKGKVFPDSFSATVPIWCTVINRAVAQVFQKEKD